MRLAVIADVHGNLPALQAVLADIAARNVDRTLNLGDCVSGPLWPRETMDLLEQRDFLTVRGNHDRWLAQTPRQHMYASDAFAFDALTPLQHAALGALPARCDLPAGIVAVHGTPSDDTQYLLEDVLDGRLVLAQPAVIEQRLQGHRGRLLLCAHSHLPRVTRSGDGTLIVNPGSVGCPAYSDPTPPAHCSESGSPHARYALLTQEAGQWRVALIAIAYDWHAAARRAADSGRPEWARALATGFIS